MVREDCQHVLELDLDEIKKAGKLELFRKFMNTNNLFAYSEVKEICKVDEKITFEGYKGDPPDYYVEAHASKKSQELSKKYYEDKTKDKPPKKPPYVKA